MKKLIISFILFLICFSVVHAQTWKLGKFGLRFSPDSNICTVFSDNPGPVYLQGLANSKFFRFDPHYFNWSPILGLTLLNTNNYYDSISLKSLIILKDTGDGESIPYQSRSYKLYKPYYANSPDLFDLHVLYQSSDNTQGTIGRSQDFNLINTVYTLYQNLNQIDITGMGYAVQVSPFSRPGNYLLNLNYEYEFVNAIDDGQDEINVIIIYNSTEIRNYHHRLKHANLTSNDLRLSSSIIIPINISDITQILEIQIFGNNSLSTRLYLYNLSVSAVLIN